LPAAQQPEQRGEAEMKIVLISTDDDPWALGMRCVSAVLREAARPPRLIFMETEKASYSPKILAELDELVRDADIIGFSCLARGSERAKQVIRHLRPQKKFIVWGGVHACLAPEDCVDLADLVCLGEGEGFILELVERLENGQDWHDIQNAAYRQDGKLVKNPLRPLIANLDEVPLPDYWTDDEYHLNQNGLYKADTSPDVADRAMIAFNGSRGCAFRCTYCCNIKLKKLYEGIGNYVRRMSPARVLEHLQTLRQIYPQAKYIYFIDEDFTARPTDELIELVQGIKEKVGLPYECMGHPARITTEKMDAMVNTGLWRIRIGVETGSERTKKEIYDRHVSNEAVIRATQIISSYPQVTTQYFFIIANPYEERQDLLDTIHLIADMAYGSNIWVFDLVFFPGSEIYDRAVRDGLLAGKGDSGYELDYRAGFHYKNLPWKKRNLYLNGLLYLMEGLCTRSRLGSVPRFALPFLTRPGWISFNDRVPVFIRGAMLFKDTWLALRHFGARVVRKFIKDPSAVYNPLYYLKKKLGLRSAAS